MVLDVTELYPADDDDDDDRPRSSFGIVLASDVRLSLKSARSLGGSLSQSTDHYRKLTDGNLRLAQFDYDEETTVPDRSRAGPTGPPLSPP